MRGVRHKSAIMSESHHESDQGHGLILEQARPKLKRPSMYRVVLLNDDYTPMEFVVQILEEIFSLDRTTATRIRAGTRTRRDR